MFQASHGARLQYTNTKGGVGMFKNLSFKDKNAETEYRNERIQTDIKSVRFSIISLSLTYLLMSFFDPYFIVTTYADVMWVRYAVFLPFSLFFFGLSFSKIFLRFYNFIIMTYIVGITIIHAYVSTLISRTEHGYSYVLIIYALMLLLTYPIYGLKMRYCVAHLAIVIVANIFVDISRHNIFYYYEAIQIMAAEAVVLITFTVIGCGVGYGLDVNRRAAYESRVNLEHQNNILRTHNVELKGIAERDGLTGLYNKLAFNNRIVEELKTCCEEKTNVGVIMIDIDWFKFYNDTYGHLDGDKCLKSVASIVRNSVRSTDFVARFGGEELVIVVKNPVGKMVLHKMCKQIQANIYDQNIPHTASKFQRVTVSLGAVFAPSASISSKEQLIEIADKSLYKAKSCGRNQYVIENLS